MKPLLATLAAIALALPSLISGQSSTPQSSSGQGASESGSSGPGLSGYDQPYRPQIHFSPQKNWTNDPNGLVFFEGEYHLFFQYDPTGTHGEHKSWGHAVSHDLVHWQELPVAIPEDAHGQIYTGSTVVDTHNTSGFCANHHACLVAIYTVDSHASNKGREMQNIAYSNDRGRTWIRYEKNPVLDLEMSDFRDPSVSWNEQARKWIMAVALPNEHKVRFYASPDLKKWALQGEFGPAGNSAGQWECPDLLQIPSATSKETLWALKMGINPNALQGGSGEQYFLGNFDGSHFTPINEPTAQGQSAVHGWTNYGKDDYCAISFNNLPSNAKPVLLGWMSNWQYAGDLPTSPWRGQMSLGRRLTYIHDKAGYALRQSPVVEPLRTGAPQTISSSHSTPITSTAPYELDLNFPQQTKEPTGIRLRSDADHYTEIGFDPARKIFYIDRTHSSIEIAKDFPTRTETAIAPTRPVNLTLIVDRSSIEAYAQDGTIAMTDLIFPPTTKSSLEFFPTSGHAIIGKLWRLKSIWPPTAQ